MTETNENEDITFFKTAVQEYLKLEEEIKVLEQAVKQRKEKKKHIGDTILTFLIEKDISHVNLQGEFQGKQLHCHNMDVKSSLKIENIAEALKKVITTEEDLNKAIGFIEEQRTVVQKSKLKIGKIKVAKGVSKADTTEEIQSHLEDLNTIM